MTKIDPITVEVIGSALTSIVEEWERRWSGPATPPTSKSDATARRPCSTAMATPSARLNTSRCISAASLASFRTSTSVIPPMTSSPATSSSATMPMRAAQLTCPTLFLPNRSSMGTPWWVAVNTAHHADFADRGHAHIYQEGIRIPPVRLYREGVLQKDLQDLFLLNCQVPHERLSDLRAQMSANRLCVRRMQDLCTKYGAYKVLAAGDALQDYAERKMRAGIAAIPDGTYSFTDYFDSNQFAAVMEFKVDITVKGDAMHLAFDAPPQVAAGLNVIYTALLATCYYAVKAVIDPTILPNAGLSRPITVEAPYGSLLNCKHPAAVDGRIAACQRVADLVQGALAKALPGKVTAAGNGACTGALFTGTREDGSLWVYLETIGGGAGARPTADGLSGVHVHMTNTSNLPVEALELEYPSPCCATNWSTDRPVRAPGAAVWAFAVSTASRQIAASAWKVAVSPFIPGASTAACRRPALSSISKWPENLPGTVQLKAGQIVELVTPGGGGYGVPSGRSVDGIERDLREGRITADFAERIYGYQTQHETHRAATA